MENKFFKAVKVFENVTRIEGLGGVNAFLIEGKDRALLIDGLTGTGSLKDFVKELTSLPVILVLTHGHIDHIGAAFEYGECFMHPDDIAMMYSPMHSSREGRYGFATMGGQVEGVTVDDVVPAVPVHQRQRRRHRQWIRKNCAAPSGSASAP